jgi:hypothetical protein
MLTTISLALAFACNAAGQTEAPPKDLRAELPRDVRIILLGVPSVRNSRIAAENLRKAIDDLQANLAGENADRNKIEQDRFRVYFRLGQFDDALAVLKQSLRDQERIKGLEAYRDFARALELHSETLASFTGTSEAPTVSEDGDAPVSNPMPSSPADLVKQLRNELVQIEELLARIEEKARPDEERKAQLEKDVGSLGQFVFQIRNLTEDIRAAEAGHGTVRVDTSEIVRGVQGLIDVIRERKREREARPSIDIRTNGIPRDSTNPPETRRERIRL